MSTKSKWKEVNTMRMERSTFWKLDDSSESKIVPMRNREPKVTCLTFCKCFPAQALQVYELAISCKQHNTISGQADISGFFAIRDYYDKRRVYIFNNKTTDTASTIEFTKVAGKKKKKAPRTVGKLRIVTPHRGILYGDLVFDYDLCINYVTAEGLKEELKIEGKALYKEMLCPYSSEGKKIRACIPIKGNGKINRMDLKFVRFPQGIEAMIEVRPPEGLNFRLTASIGEIPGEIILLHESEYSKPSDHGRPLKFVLVMPLLDVLELKFDSPKHGAEISASSLYHGLHQQDIDLGSSKVHTTITWSRM